jgi:hypothetical protein
MSVTFVRIGRPHPGKQRDALEMAKKRASWINEHFKVGAKVQIRLGGPVGEVLMVAEFPDAGAVEKLKRAVIKAGPPISSSDIFDSIREEMWMSVDE